jgi:hypothetical protein
MAMNADPQTAARTRNSARFRARLTRLLFGARFKRFRKRPDVLAAGGVAEPRAAYRTR